MARTLTSAVLAELSKDSVQAVHLVEAVFDNATYRATDAYKDIVYSGNTFNAVGHFMQFSGIEQNAQMVVQQAQVSFSGVDQIYIAEVFNFNCIGRSMRVWVAFLNASGALILDPIMFVDGVVDSPTIEDDPETGANIVSFTVVNQWRNFDRVNGRISNSASQQFYFPGDLGLEFSSQVDQPLYWGRPTPAGA